MARALMHWDHNNNVLRVMVLKEWHRVAQMLAVKHDKVRLALAHWIGGSMGKCASLAHSAAFACVHGAWARTSGPGRCRPGRAKLKADITVHADALHALDKLHVLMIGGGADGGSLQGVHVLWRARMGGCPAQSLSDCCGRSTAHLSLLYPLLGLSRFDRLGPVEEHIVKTRSNWHPCLPIVFTKGAMSKAFNRWLDYALYKPPCCSASSSLLEVEISKTRTAQKRNWCE
eukprot:scaffold22199_cov21-Tisochrysis_lutea.AAC.1